MFRENDAPKHFASRTCSTADFLQPRPFCKRNSLQLLAAADAPNLLIINTAHFRRQKSSAYSWECSHLYASVTQVLFRDCINSSPRDHALTLCRRLSLFCTFWPSRVQKQKHSITHISHWFCLRARQTTPLLGLSPAVFIVLPRS